MKWFHSFYFFLFYFNKSFLMFRRKNKLVVELAYRWSICWPEAVSPQRSGEPLEPTGLYTRWVIHINRIPRFYLDKGTVRSWNAVSHWLFNLNRFLKKIFCPRIVSSEEVKLSAVCENHKEHYMLEYHSVCPLVRIGGPPLTPSPQRVYRCSVPLPPELKWGGHSPACEGVGESQFRRLEKKLSTLSTLLWKRSFC